MSTQAFFEQDHAASLFPMKTTLILIQNHEVGLQEYIAKILSDDPGHVGYNFLPQTRVHAAKPKNHLRRTVVLDPVASYFLYDLVYRNRHAFDQPEQATRRSFGYRFDNDKPMSVHRAYQDFTFQVNLDLAFNDHSISFDVAAYFNSIYHHDATNWFSSLPGVSGVDANAFGRFFREINSGRSVDFLPQGIYPAKVIGSAFLNFVNSSGQIKSTQLLRFMDDIYLFDDNEGVLIQDFLRVQELLGLRGLNVNSSKTSVDGAIALIQDGASQIRTELAEIAADSDDAHRYFGSGVDAADVDDEEEDEEDEEEDEDGGDDGEGDENDKDAADGKTPLNETQIERLLELLSDPTANETDAEIILGILHKNMESIASYVPTLLARFPNIVKQLHKIVGLLIDKEQLARGILEIVSSNVPLIEYQLFWIAVIAEDHLIETPAFGPLILKLYERSAEHKIVRAKILEIPIQTFGLKEIRDEILKTGSSDWSSWASAMGTRTLLKAERNYALKYFSKGSPINWLISECVQKLP